MSTSLSLFHPVVRRWFEETLGEPTAAQERGWASIRAARPTLIAAPTGSGKTLAAFLGALDELFQEGLRDPLPDEVRVVYVSPLKALSADIHKNLAEPRLGIRRLAEEQGVEGPRITAAVRTGDTTQSERAAMLRRPPHILVTTPESLYLLLTAEKSRAMLRTVRTVIVDEIHAVIGTRRGAHLALSLERLEKVAERRLLRIGLSATQKPIEEVARWLVGNSPDAVPCGIVDEGHRRALDLGLEMPRSPLEAVMSAEVWNEYYERLAELIAAHRTTLIFVNTRKMAERVARHLSERIGEEAVTAHHGSLSKESRLAAERRLKNGELKALVATASLELGIDIGHVDLVCQLGSPHRIATFLQRVGRSGHTISGMPRGRIFPASRDDLVECASLLRAVRRGELDRIVMHDAPLDVLAQQLVAEASCGDWDEEDLYRLVRSARPYRDLARSDFDAVLRMTAEGFATRRGRRGALVHRDEVNGRVKGRRGSRMLAISSGGAIPELADYRVVAEPEETFIGTLNEDFAIESNVGDIFQLGNASWQVLQVGAGTVRVADAKGAPPTIPFWLGEAPARSDELSSAVSELRADLDGILEEEEPASAIAWLVRETGVPLAAAEEIVSYLAESRRILGVLPTQQTLVLERFFDESGGMQLVLHAPFGSRINKAWGLALRKRFCRQFDFELQAAATEDAILLSLGPQHSFPLSDVFRYLHPVTAREVLVQAFLDAPVWQTRWRWNATVSLAVPRNRGGKKVPPQLQRTLADDLMAAVFPAAAACVENIGGDREIPDHPLVHQAVRDCLEEAMDIDGLTAVLERVHRGELTLVARDTPEPSLLTHEILNAKPYAFLDDAPLEERRAMAVYARRSTDPSSAGDLGALDAAAIARVCEEARPDPRDADELHDALLIAGMLTPAEFEAIPAGLFERLAASRRAARWSAGSEPSVGSEWSAGVESSVGSEWSAGVPPAGRRASRPAESGENLQVNNSSSPNGHEAPAGGPRTGGPEARAPLAGPSGWLAAERLPELRAIHPGMRVDPELTVPASRDRAWTREEAILEMIRGRMTIAGPVTAVTLASELGAGQAEVDAALVALEGEGAVLRGTFTPGAAGLEWCDRRLLARIHRYTLTRLRSEIEPVSAADFMRFLFRWQHVAEEARLSGGDGLREIVAQLDGFEVAAAAWERAVLPARMDRYDPSMLDMLCLTGEVGWARLSDPVGVPAGAVDGPTLARLVSATPVALFLRANGAAWRTLRGIDERIELALTDRARRVLESLRSRGASFARDLAIACELEEEDLHLAIGELASAGLIASDGFAGLRSLVRAAPARRPARDSRPEAAGRWSLLGEGGGDGEREQAVENQARVLLRRYGVVFRRIVAREPNAAPWRELSRVYRRLEMRGEIRGGRFVHGMSGEQFALPEAVTRLREVRREKGEGRVVVLSASDPLNLTGILDAAERIRAVGSTRVAYRDGVAVSVMEGDYLRPLTEVPDADSIEIATALAGRRVPVGTGFVGRT